MKIDTLKLTNTFLVFPFLHIMPEQIEFFIIFVYVNITFFSFLYSHDNACITMPNVTGIFIFVCLALVCLTPTNYFAYKSSASRNTDFFPGNKKISYSKNCIKFYFAKYIFSDIFKSCMFVGKR